MYKVIFPNAKKLTSAVIYDPEGKIYIDSALYYYGTESEVEAHYLCGMLNIPLLATSVKSISDTRHHHKRPLYFNIKKFNASEDQLAIANLSQICHELMKEYSSNHEKLKELEYFSIIHENLKQIDEIGLKTLRAEAGEKIIREYE